MNLGMLAARVHVRFSAELAGAMGKVDARRWSAREETLRRQVFVDIWPVDDKSATDKAEVLSLRLGRMQQSRIPGQWDGQGPAIE
jgi:hypothetical protein